MISLSFTCSAFAEPTENDPVTAIDNGSTVTVLTRINIPNFNKILFQNGNRYSFYSEVSGNGKPFCRLYAQRKDGSDYSQDVAISAGRELVQVQNTDAGYAASLGFQLADGGRLYLDCFAGMNDGAGLGVPTIGQFKQALNSILKLNLAAPVEL